MRANALLSIAGFGLLLASCSSVIPSASGPTNFPAPSSAPSSAPASSSPVQDLPAERAAKPIASTPVPALPAAQSNGDSSTAAGLGVVRGPDIRTLGITDNDARGALSAFNTSCRSVIWRNDTSGLTQGADWREACDAAKTWNGDAVTFFATYLDAVQVSDGKSFVTGYFEPEILGSKKRIKGYDVPVYARPADLIDADLGQFNDDLKDKKIRGKIVGTEFTLYDDRAAIDGGALEGRGLEIAWAKDPIDFFFLQIQGSGRLRAPDGTIMRIGYASQNGRDYTGIGRLMAQRGLLGPGESSLQGITAWLRRNPEEGVKIMHENKSYVFFQELTGDGPLGALGLPVVAESSVAADPKFTPLGAPVWLSMDRAEPNGMWIAQDTGGAIKGANRFDSFWGAGERAKAISGGMAARGSALIFLPKVSLRRLGL